MKHLYYSVGAALTIGMSSGAAHATANNFGSISSNIVDGIAGIPGLISALGYLFGLLLGVLGIMKIKDHVENPTQTPLKDGAIRLAAGGALFAMPIIFDAMSNTIDTADTSGFDAAKLNKVKFHTN